MGWLIELRVIIKRTHSFTSIVKTVAQLLNVNTGIQQGLCEKLSKETLSIFDLIDNFYNTYKTKNILDAKIEELLKDFIQLNSDRYKQVSNSFDEIKLAVINFGLLSNQLDFFMSDKTTYFKSIIERSFHHLQRLIIVDKTIRSTWRKIYDKKREPELEQYGAVHLLHHGIWAFKADASGGRTDLILGNSITQPQLDEIQSVTEIMVLTEWKKLKKTKKKNDDMDKAIEAAYAQAQRYTNDTLFGFELKDIRYLVIVGEKIFKNSIFIKEKDKEKNGILYKVVCIDVDPKIPSKSNKL